MAATRPVQCINKPTIHPFVCIQCGSQQKDYFIDTGLDVPDEHFKPLWEGIIYFCCECANNLVNDITRAIARWEAEHERGTESESNDGTSNDPSNDGLSNGESNESDELVAVVSGDESQSEPPVAATLESTIFFWRTP